LSKDKDVEAAKKKIKEDRGKRKEREQVKLKDHTLILIKFLISYQ